MTVLKGSVYPTFVAVAPVGATIAGNAYILDSQLKKLKDEFHGRFVELGESFVELGESFDDLKTEVGNRMSSVETGMKTITDQQDKLKGMASKWVTGCSKAKGGKK